MTLVSTQYSGVYPFAKRMITQQRINKAMQLMLDGEIESFDYKAIKSRFQTANTTLLQERTSLEMDKVDYSTTINGCFNLLKHLYKLYDKASVNIKQRL